MLTKDQIEEVRAELVQKGDPVRFMIDGQAVDIITGVRQAKGINVIHQVHYWNFTRETAKKIAGWIGATPVFSE